MGRKWEGTDCWKTILEGEGLDGERRFRSWENHSTGPAWGNGWTVWCSGLTCPLQAMCEGRHSASCKEEGHALGLPGTLLLAGRRKAKANKNLSYLRGRPH